MKHQYQLMIEDLVKNHQNVVFVTGAGISTSAGIPDFLKMKGLVDENGRYYEPYEILSREFYWSHREMYQKFIDGMKSYNVKPTNLHKLISKFKVDDPEKNIKIVTQNIDDLHEQSNKLLNVDIPIISMHGSLYKKKCSMCDYPQRFNLDVEKCLECESTLFDEPSIVLYGDELMYSDMTNCYDAMEAADIIIVLGTELKVEPVSSFVFNRFDKVIFFNKNRPSSIDNIKKRFINGKYRRPKIRFYELDFNDIEFDDDCLLRN